MEGSSLREAIVVGSDPVMQGTAVQLQHFLTIQMIVLLLCEASPPS